MDLVVAVLVNDCDQGDVSFYVEGFKFGCNFVELFMFVVVLIGYDN